MALANIVVRTTGSGISTLASNVDAGIVKKGTPLTHIEVDTNFLEIADTVKHLPINNLSDVTITSASTGQVLKYNGSAWVNDTDAGGPADTDALSEGSSNLYFTNARARAAISEGSTQLAYNSGTGVLTFTQGDSDTVAEGSTNLYYTDARVDARLVEKSFSIHTADFNATSGSRHAIDTSSNTVTATLPGSPATGDAIFFADAGGNYATNKLTLGRNGNTIMGLTQDMDVTTNNQSVGVFYNGTTWRIY